MALEPQQSAMRRLGGGPSAALSLVRFPDFQAAFATGNWEVGAAAITFGFSFLGFFSSRFRLFMPLAMGQLMCSRRSRRTSQTRALGTDRYDDRIWSHRTSAGSWPLGAEPDPALLRWALRLWDALEMMRAYGGERSAPSRATHLALTDRRSGLPVSRRTMRVRSP